MPSLRLSVMLVSGLLLLPGRSHASTFVDSLDAEGVVRLAVLRSAVVVDAEAALALAGGDRMAAGVRPNPELELVGGTVDGGGARTAAALTVPLSPLFERGLKIRAARGAEAAAAFDLSAARSRAAAAALEGYCRVLHARGLAEQARRRVTLASRLLDAARARVRSGDAARVDAVVAEIELSRARSESLVRDQAHADATGALLLLLRMDPVEAPPISGDLADRTRFAAVVAHGEMRAAAGVRALEAQLQKLRAERALAGRGRWPELAFRLDYEREDGLSAWMPGAAITLPLFDPRRGERGMAAIRLARAERELESARIAAQTRFETARAARDAAAAALAELEAHALPRSREVEAMAEQSYRAGKTDLAWLLVLRRDALATQDEYNDRLLELALRGIDLAVASGAWPAGAEGENP